MSSLSSALRLFFSPIANPTLIPLKSPSSLFLFISSPISFQRLPNATHRQPIRALDPSSSTAGIDPSLLPAALRDIVALFQSAPDPKSKYHQLLHYGRNLPPLDPAYKTDDHRVRGCVSQVWVRAFRDPEDPDAVRFEADSDSALTKGLAALLVIGLSGSLASDIARVPPDFVHLLGLRQSLTPSRNNGFLNMLRLMQLEALRLSGLDFGAKDSILGNDSGNSIEKANGFGGNLEISEVSGANGLKFDGGDDGSAVVGENFDVEGGVRIVGSDFGTKDRMLEEEAVVSDEKPNGFPGNLVISEVSGANGVKLDKAGDGDDGGDVVEGDDGEEFDADTPSSRGGFIGRAERIRQRLERELSPVELVVEDISHQHAGHAAVRASNGGETHFNLRVVSKEFEGKSLVKRHRLVYGLLQEELQSGLHALSIDAKTPSEVQCT